MFDQKNIQLVNKKFKYEKDGIIDDWSVLVLNNDNIKGDCEDYSLTLLWLESKKNLITFLFFILIHKYTIVFCKTPSGVGHAILYHDGEYIDNIMKTPVTKSVLKEAGYSMFIPFPNFAVFLKLLVGKLI